jgi:ACS family hexuronate transporter-like MFS transporter
MGIINAGTAVRSVLAPPLIGIILLTAGWRMVFLAAGAVGFAWVISWSVTYRSNNETSIATLDARLVARKLSFTDVLSIRGPHDRSNLHGKLSAQTNDVLYAQNEASQCNI